MPFPRALTRQLRGRAGRVALRFAGHIALADLEHVGRSSGVVRHTPLRAFRSHDQVVVGLNFGRESDWWKNIQAAGGCRMRLGPDVLDLGAPRLVPVAEGMAGMPRLFGLALRYVVRTADCVVMPVLASTPADDRKQAPRLPADG
jgi:deazaflavin-dependent oxidoreductase (nitroreductase family)